MTPSSGNAPRFVVTTPIRSVCDHFARCFQKHDLLRLYAVGTRRCTQGISPELTRLRPLIGLLSYIANKTMSVYQWESFRFSLHPMLDRWVKKMLQPDDSILSSYAYANECFEWVRKHGGKTFLDGGNSHPENFWEILIEEHRRWNSPYPPVSPAYYERCKAMMEHVDYVFAPSRFVANSFLERGFSPEQVLPSMYPIDLRCFSPSSNPRPKDRPLRVINTGGICLRKGSPYLLEAFRLILKQEPTAQLLLNSGVIDNMKPIMERYGDLPIDWSPSIPHPLLAERLRSADVFVLPSLEDGFGLVVGEALACGLPVVTTPNTGACDLIVEGKNGSVVPIRDPQAIADAVLSWWQRIRDGGYTPEGAAFDTGALSTERFETMLEKHLASLEFLLSSP